MWRDLEIGEMPFHGLTSGPILVHFQGNSAFLQGTPPWHHEGRPLYDCRMDEAIKPGPETSTQAASLPEISVVAVWDGPPIEQAANSWQADREALSRPRSAR